MSSRGIVQAFVCCAVLLTACPGQGAEPSRQSLISAGHERNYALYVPDSAHNAKSPLVLLLHGSYDKGEHMVALWRDVADREGVVLAAPNATHYDGWRPKLDTPHFIAEVINDAARRTPIDMRRLYLFGQSGGADFALLLAMMESRAFAAMAIHAGAWRHPDEFKLMRFAQRRIPLKIIVGDRDEFFALKDVRATQSALNAAGFQIEVEIVPLQHHAYDENTAPGTNESAWSFLRGKALEEPPQFTDYVP